MCGRTCLTLDAEQVVCACKYTTKSATETEMLDTKKTFKGNEPDSAVKNIIPEWRSEYNCGRTYLPSYNIAPTDITPVLVSSAHFNDNDESISKQRRVVVPMMWGMIPFWHKGDYRKHGLTTNNCRLEHMIESKLYRGPFRRGQRCVVLCEGFYEWQTTRTSKPSERAAYLIYMTQNTDDIKIYDKTTWQSPSDVNLLKMAGLFDVWEDGNGDKIYSYTVITFESTKIMSWMHHRMPAILETEQQIDDWLDYKRVTDEVALAALRPATDLKWHRVAKLVNNSRNKSEQCNKPIEYVTKLKKLQMNKTMHAWLNMRKTRENQIATNLKDRESDSDISDSDDDDSEKCYVGPKKRTSSDETSQLSVRKRGRFQDHKEHSSTSISSGEDMKSNTGTSRSAIPKQETEND